MLICAGRTNDEPDVVSISANVIPQASAEMPCYQRTVKVASGCN